MTTLLHVVGARPNFMKVAPVLRAARAYPTLHQVLVHTGQHYDPALSDSIFADLELPVPDENLGVGSASHAVQTAQIMLRFEPLLERYAPDWVLVYGDVNSTVACALVAAKRGVKVAHVEAGLRSRDRSMPEELNRLLTDQLADLCLTPSRDADRNLLAEGIEPQRIRFVGNVMVDTLLHLRERARALAAPRSHGVAGRPYAFVTFHRPSNVDHPETLREILEALDELARQMPVLFPIHPRTRRRIEEFGLRDLAERITLLEPVGYLEAVSLVEEATLVVTDSGGLQEETTVLGVPCLTARPNTERPVTLTEGTNRLVASTRAAIGAAVADILRRARNGSYRPSRPEGWDGHAAERIAALLAQT
ncbi:MAG TPA: UDP-N-acetylglucosamine 2-epimerase (non-hydrolyzing) [Gemmatimonadales bacterium]|jgi:UDP-N-acetylglucosamine 2-epimerase (non-hydrolysing)|nr:UDP-N-acetylglucosamine 2-epimerase (non-hydrolyzing) [Gemmatimonadales bacterium]